MARRTKDLPDLSLLDANNAAIDALEVSVTSAYSAYVERCETLLSSLVTEWKEKGGCERCSGTGQVLTWSTLDGPGWDEFGTCPACEGRRGKNGPVTLSRECVYGGTEGYHPTAYGRSGSASARYSTVDAAERFFSAELADLRAAWHAAKNAQSTVLPSSYRKRGDLVIVAKGRKVPVGTVGVYLASSESKWGLSYGILLATGNVVWIPSHNTKPFIAAHTELAQDLMIALVENDKSYRADKGLKPRDPAIYTQIVRDGNTRGVKF